MKHADNPDHPLRRWLYREAVIDQEKTASQKALRARQIALAELEERRAIEASKREVWDE